jgi:hypothetical protein
MSDIDSTRKPALTGPVEHYCQHPGCKLWGGWGYERSRGETDWYCYEHRPDVYRNEIQREVK